MLENNHENIISGTYLGQKECILLRRYSWSMGTVWTGMGCQGSSGSHTWGPAGGNSPEYAQRIDCSTAESKRMLSTIYLQTIIPILDWANLLKLVQSIIKHVWTCEDALGRHEHPVHVRAPGYQPLAVIVSLQQAAVPGTEPLPGLLHYCQLINH